MAEAFLEGLVYPPPVIREIVDKTALHIGKRGSDGSQLESKIREKAAARFSFINDSDPYHAYYQHRLKQVRAGEDIGAGVVAQKVQEVQEVDDGRPKVAQPPPFEFLLDPPPIAPVDMDIIKLTALFTARSGRKFQQDLAQREKTNYQFDFLQPSHTLFSYFNRLVEQYTKVLIPDEERLARLSLQAGYGGPDGRQISDDTARRTLGRREVLNDLDARIQWTKFESEQQKKAEDEAERERVAFAEVDWQDFIVVTTVEFTDQDEMIDLPAPMALADVERLSLRDKRQAALAMNGQDTEQDEDAVLQEARNVQAAVEGVNAAEDVLAEMDVESDDEESRKKVDEIKTADTTAPVTVKPAGYIPKSKRGHKVKTTPCTICGQQIPVEEYAEHVRIELLDPKWKERQATTDANRSASALLGTGADVSASLAKLASQRSDIFSETSKTEIERRKAAEEAARRKAKDREAVVWDGHVASGDMTQGRFQAGSNIDNQIRALHQAKGLTEDDATNTGPQIGPYGAKAAPVFTPIQPAQTSGSTISAAPQAGLNNAYNPYGQRVAMQQQQLNAATVRKADAIADDEPGAKRTKLAKLPNGAFHDEQTWISAHPNGIQLFVQMPASGEKPEWKCQGQQLPLEDVPIDLLVATLRDRVNAKTGIPVGRQQLRYNDRILTNSSSLASLNFEDGDIIGLTVKDRKK